MMVPQAAPGVKRASIVELIGKSVRWLPQKVKLLGIPACVSVTIVTLTIPPLPSETAVN